MIRRVIAVVLAATFALNVVPLFAGPAPRRQPQTTGTVNGTAQDAQGQNLANYRVQIRNADTGRLSASTTTGARGQFSFVGLDPANYVVEIVDPAGNIIGTSAALNVVAGATLSVTVGATMTGAAAALAAGGTAFWTSTAGILTLAAVGAGVTTGVVVAADRKTVSPSR